VYLASRRSDRTGLLRELRLRQDSGIHVDFLRRDDLMLRYGARRRYALYSADAATVDPVRLARRLLDDAGEQRGTRTFSRAMVQRVEPRADHVVLQVADGHRVRARHAVVCAGHESLPMLPERLATLHTTFATITDPVTRSMPRRSRAVFWETARPYLYVRETADGRVLVGGQDIAYRGAVVRNGLIRRQAGRLLRRYARLFGERLKPAHAWAGHYAATADGLPFVGSWPDGPDRVLFALCFGGNGMIHAAQAREMLRARLRGDGHPLDDVYGFERL
jgi:glycine/D-amino acid oxidase-like deaminating enzyme